jgi:acyl dehydratase
MPLKITDFDNLASYVEQKLGVSKWHTITQAEIDAFAEITHDAQWIHTDVKRAEHESPYKTTVAHGHLLLSLAPYFVRQVVSFPTTSLTLNYGLNRVRFTAPVPAGSRLRVHVLLSGFKATEQGLLITLSLR